MNLARAHHIQKAEQRLQLEVRPGFLDRFADGALGQGLAEFHEAGRQSPETLARLDVAAAQQHLFAPDRQRADHIQRVLVVHDLAGAAHRTVAVVIGRHEVIRGRAAGLAMPNAA